MAWLIFYLIYTYVLINSVCLRRTISLRQIYSLCGAWSSSYYMKSRYTSSLSTSLGLTVVCIFCHLRSLLSFLVDKQVEKYSISNPSALTLILPSQYYYHRGKVIMTMSSVKLKSTHGNRKQLHKGNLKGHVQRRFITIHTLLHPRIQFILYWAGSQFLDPIPHLSLFLSLVYSTIDYDTFL